MTVTIGRRELLAALGGAAAARPLGARAASGETWWSREKLRRNHVNDRGDKCQMRHI